MELPTIDKFVKDVAEKALDEFIYEGKTVREWIEIIVKQQPCDDCISREDAIGIVARIKEMHIDDKEQYPINYGTICDIDLALQQLPTVTPHQTRWIPVTERLPDMDGMFLTYIENPYDSQLSYEMLCDYINQKWCPVDETASNNVTAWMPLPEPYKESEEIK